MPALQSASNTPAWYAPKAPPPCRTRTICPGNFCCFVFMCRSAKVMISAACRDATDEQRVQHNAVTRSEVNTWHHGPASVRSSRRNERRARTCVRPHPGARPAGRRQGRDGGTHRPGSDGVGGGPGRVPAAGLAAVPGVRPAPLPRLCRGAAQAPRRLPGGAAAHAGSLAAARPARLEPLHAVRVARAALQSAFHGRQQRRAAGRRCCHLRVDLRGHRRGPPLRAGPVLHPARRRRGPGTARAAAGARRRRRAGAPAVRQGRQLRPAERLRRRVAGRRRLGAGVRPAAASTGCT